MKIFYCSHCENQIFFNNYLCFNCHHPVGFVPALRTMLSFEIVAEGWRSIGYHKKFYKPCRNYKQYQVCNWMIDIDLHVDLCPSCELTTVIPDLQQEKNIEYWIKLETAKRRFLYLTLFLGIFPRPKQHTEDHLGLSFQFLVPTDNQPVLTGHSNGLITLNAYEADTVYRETTRISMGENYRTLLGHFRHESGHYYFSVLVQNTHWIEPFRQLFGDDQHDYSEALQRHYENGPSGSWKEEYISAYASSHPWEDWAESWAHYLHMLSTLDTAFQSGIMIHSQHRLEPELVFTGEPLSLQNFQLTIKNWFALSYGLNALNRSMGLDDAYPFTLSDKVIEKLHFIHQVLTESVPELQLNFKNF